MNPTPSLAAWCTTDVERYRQKHEQDPALQNLDPLELPNRLSELATRFAALLNSESTADAFLDIAGETLAIATMASMHYAGFAQVNPRRELDKRLEFAIREADESERHGEPITASASDTFPSFTALASVLLADLAHPGRLEDPAQPLRDLQRWCAQLAVLAIAIARDIHDPPEVGVPDELLDTLAEIASEIRTYGTSRRGDLDQRGSPVASLLISIQPNLDTLHQHARTTPGPLRDAILLESRSSWIRAAADWAHLAHNLERAAGAEDRDPLDTAAGQAAKRIVAGRLTSDPARVDLEELWDQQTLRLALLANTHLAIPQPKDAPVRAGSTEAIEQLAALLIGLWAINATVLS
jgi:hypothetical protein